MLFREGMYFGEICLLKENRRTKTIRAKQYLDLCVLSKQKFDVVLEEHTKSAIKILRAMELKVAEYSTADNRWTKLRKTIYMNASEQIKESSRALAMEMANAEHIESNITSRRATVKASIMKEHGQDATKSLTKDSRCPNNQNSKRQDNVMAMPGPAEENTPSSVVSPVKTLTAHPSLQNGAEKHDVMKSVGRILEAKFEELENNFARSMEQAESKLEEKLAFEMGEIRESFARHGIEPTANVVSLSSTHEENDLEVEPNSTSTSLVSYSAPEVTKQRRKKSILAARLSTASVSGDRSTRLGANG